MPDLKPGDVGSVVDLAIAMGVSRQTCHDWQNKPGFPDAVEGVFTVRLVAEWRCRREFEAERKRVMASVGDDDPLLVAGDSPGLERYRMAKAKLTELDLAERERLTWSADVVHDVLEIQSSGFRRACEILQREFGPGAYDILFETVEENVRQMNTYFGQLDDSKQAEGQ